MTEENETVNIPRTLFQKLEEEIKGTEFASVSSYVAFLLREVMAEKAKPSQQAFSREDEEKVKDRLRALGYI